MAYFNQTQPYYPMYQPQTYTNTSAAVSFSASPQNTFVWVSGEQAARSYPVAPGATVLMMDSDASTFYIKKADASGKPFPLEIYDFVRRDETPAAAAGANQNFVKMEELDGIIEEKVKAILSANKNKNKGGGKL